MKSGLTHGDVCALVGASVLSPHLLRSGLSVERDACTLNPLLLVPLFACFVLLFNFFLRKQIKSKGRERKRHMLLLNYL